MASSKSYLDFILEQLSELEDISHRSMMGEYIIYYRGKVIGGIYDDRFLMKPVKSALDMVPVIAPNRSGNRAVFPMRWGYSGKTLLMNARTETAVSKPTFKEDWQKHRCIIPASWYFEWEHRLDNDGKKHTGDKYMIQPKDSTMTWLCGLYRIEDGLPHFVVLTREPGEEIRFIHDRMPLIMPEHLIDQWIRPDVKPEELVGAALTEMVFEKTV